MLPPGFAADVAPAPVQAVLRPLLAGGQTVAALRTAACACDLRLRRDGEDERHLRRRYVALGLSRTRIIAALERHRQAQPGPGQPAARRASLADFVVEHARNAGPTLYWLGFGEEPGNGLPSGAGGVQTISAAAVRAAADSWLEENRLTAVAR